MTLADVRRDPPTTVEEIPPESPEGPAAQHGRDPGLREAGLRPLHAEPRPLQHAPVARPGGHRRRLRGGHAPGRPDLRDLPRPRAHPRAGRRHDERHGRVHGPVHRSATAARAARCTSPTSRRGCSARYAIVGAHLPIAIGAALGARCAGAARSSSASSATAPTNIGAFHEALNLAAVWKLPVVFVCENNLYREYTPIGEVTAVEHPRPTGRPPTVWTAIVIDGNDVEAVYVEAGRALEQCRSRPGARADRGDDLPARRPLPRRPGPLPAAGRGRRVGGSATRSPPTEQRLLEAGVVDEAQLARIDAEVLEQVNVATEAAKAGPAPDRGRAADRAVGRRRIRMAELTMREAVA